MTSHLRHRLAALALLLAIQSAGNARAQEPARPQEPAAEPPTATARPENAGAAIPWYHDIERAFAVAREGRRVLLIDFGAEWCGFCKKLDRETFGNAEVIAFVSELCIGLKIDTDKHPELGRRFSVAGLPTIVFLDAGAAAAAGAAEAEAEHEHEHKDGDGHDHEHDHALPPFQELGRIEGYRPPDLFLVEARKAVQAGASLAELRQAAEDAPDDADAQRAYARALLVGGQTEQAVVVLEAARARQPSNLAVALELGDVLRMRSEFGRAADLLGAALADARADQGSKRQAAVPLARCLISLARLAEAEKALGVVLDDPSARVEPARPDPAPAEPAEPAEKPAEEPAAGEAVEGAPKPRPPAPSLDARLLEGLFLRGYVRALLGKPGLAVEDLRRAQSGDPEGPWGLRAGFILSRMDA